MKSSPKIWFPGALALALGIMLGCETVDENEETAGLEMEKVVMQFDWIFNAQFAGFYQAVEQGFFAEEEIELEMRGGPTTPHIVDGTLNEPAISFGSSESNVLIAEAAMGKDLRIIGTMFQSSPMGWMYVRGNEIESFTDLADKRVGVHDDGWRVIKLLLQKQGVDISNLETFNCDYDPKVILEGEADAMQCYYIDEFVKLEQMIGEKAGVFLARDFGYDAFSQVMFTHAETIEKYPEVVEGFLRAVKKGWAHAFENPEETVDLIISKYSPELDRDYQLGSLAKIEELMVPDGGELLQPIESSVLTAGQEHLLKYKLIEGTVDFDKILQQQFLP
ncbi:MAG: ABC transporter substrate-binding protein [Verrucomicrobiota bacterium]